jgi:DNA polymerase V
MRRNAGQPAAWSICQAERQRKLLAKVPVEEVWGVGRRITKKLNAMGITTALELAEASSWVIRKHFNVVLERTARELRGEPCLDLEEYPRSSKSSVAVRLVIAYYAI